MEIRNIISRNRRDFYAVFECEHCGATERKYGYDDNNYHRNVIPRMKCASCGKCSPDGYVPLVPKHSDNAVI